MVPAHKWCAGIGRSRHALPLITWSLTFMVAAHLSLPLDHQRQENPLQWKLVWASWGWWKPSVMLATCMYAIFVLAYFCWLLLILHMTRTSGRRQLAILTAKENHHRAQPREQVPIGPLVGRAGLHVDTPICIIINLAENVDSSTCAELQESPHWRPGSLLLYHHRGGLSENQ